MSQEAQSDEPKRITSLTAFIADEGDGNEGIAAAMMGDKVYPLVTGDDQMVPTLREIAKKIEEQQGVTVEERLFLPAPMAKGGAA